MRLLVPVVVAVVSFASPAGAATMTYTTEAALSALAGSCSTLFCRSSMCLRFTWEAIRGVSAAWPPNKALQLTPSWTKTFPRVIGSASTLQLSV